MTTTALISDSDTQQWVGYYTENIYLKAQATLSDEKLKGAVNACTKIIASLMVEYDFTMIGNWVFWLKDQIDGLDCPIEKRFFERLHTVLMDKLKNE